MPGTSTKTAKKPGAQRVTAKVTSQSPDSTSRKIGQRIRELGDWRGAVLKRMRGLIRDADPDIVEEWNWQKPTSPGVPVWSHDGIVTTGETYKNVVKLTFAHGARLKDPSGLFNASLAGNTRRAIDIREGDEIDTAAFQALIRAAVQFNLAKQTSKGTARATTAKPKLLSGGNPQIAKADGDAPVQAYIAAMPGWKHDVGRRVDALIASNVPAVRKAVKWNSPFSGIEGEGGFLNYHCFAKFVRLAFFNGASLKPLPPGESKHKDVRYFDVREDDPFDETRLANWIRQAAALPGWKP